LAKSKVKARELKEKALRIIHLCRDVESKGFNPFEVDVKEEAENLRRLLDFWEKIEDLKLDGEALSSLAKVVELQEQWVKRRSRLQALDPETVKAKVSELTIPKLAEAFLRAWNPLVGLETLTVDRIKEAVQYWAQLKPLSERAEALKEFQLELPASSASIQEVNLGEDFERRLRETLSELEEKAEKSGGEVNYWEFVKAKDFRETVLKAYVVSFLVTYGYINLRIESLEGEAWLSLSGKRVKPLKEASIAISLEKVKGGK
jgi:hypothetical protein